MIKFKQQFSSAIASVLFMSVVAVAGLELSACRSNTPDNIDSPKVQKDSMIGAVAGGAVGAGVAAFTANPYLMAAILVPTGASIGYYVPKIKNDTHEIQSAGGEIFQIGDYVTIVIPSDKLFDIGTADYKPLASKLIKEAAMIIAGFPKSEVLVTGNTDNIGTPLYQAKLSRKQAQTIALSLWESNIINRQTFDRFQFAGMGNTKPIADENSVRGQMLNRRIQITIYPHKMSDKFDQAMQGLNPGVVE